MSLDKTAPRPRVPDPRLGGNAATPPPKPRDTPRDTPRRARKRMWRRRRRAILVAIVLVVASIAGVKAVRAATESEGPTVADYLPSQVAEGTPSASDSPSRTPSASPEPTPTVVDKGTGKWTYAKKPSDAKKYGKHGSLLKYNVAVEGGIHAKAEEFSEVVADTLADDRGWTAGDEWRFTQIGKSGSSDFTVYLASPKTREKLCGAEDTYTSCRNGNSVVVNLERWQLGVPHWTESLTSYRQYVVNHEVGHRLGEGHVVCAKKGKPSPVMAQQTVKLKGCEPNAWPYPDGKYITGPPGEYL
ncbi:MAG: DUF3152 domain-containing protein [Stackebrandtia sp.]